LMTQNFSTIARELQKNSELATKTHLLSISVDPQYDQPEILREYGARFTGSEKSNSFNQWEFAAGTAEQVKAIAQFFGMSYRTEKNQIIHSLRTAIIDANGRVFKVYRGNEWKPDQIVKDLESLSLK